MQDAPSKHPHKLHGRAGIVLRALGAIDIVLWDRNPHAAGLPLYKYLGAFLRGAVPAYVSGGYYRNGKTPEMLGNEMARYVGMDFGAIKMKVGPLNLATEEERLAGARQAVGPNVLLMLNANNADVPTALRFVKRAEQYKPYWIEEPFGPDGVENHARLAQRTLVLIATGEILAGHPRHKELLDKHAASILQPDAVVCGGATTFRRIAAIADAYGVTLCPHWFNKLHAHLVTATLNAWFVEYLPDDKVFNFRRLLDSHTEARDGALPLPELPRLSFDFDEEAITKFSLHDGGEPLASAPLRRCSSRCADARGSPSGRDSGPAWIGNHIPPEQFGLG